ncbi:MAG TPA: type II toxin-antitoxin system RelE/ParE family toxin [archaeon]|nr:type II toxin-antitoxin system RelE/ParE family toxin [archaeon]
MWEVLLHPNVDKFLNGLDSNIRERIKNKLRELKEDPFRFLEHFEGSDYYKLRVGDYRALIDIDFQNKLLKVQILDHRGKIYKRK